MNNEEFKRLRNILDSIVHDIIVCKDVLESIKMSEHTNDVIESFTLNLYGTLDKIKYLPLDFNANITKYIECAVQERLILLEQRKLDVSSSIAQLVSAYLSKSV